MANLVLGIESSCDDTAVAIVNEAGAVLSSIVKSQTKMIFMQNLGCIPEFAVSHVFLFTNC